MFITCQSGSCFQCCAIVVSLLALSACSPQRDTVAAGDDSKSAAARRGEILSYACQACHTLAPGGAHQIGPNLAGVFGRRAGAVEDFEYSAPLKDSGIVWSEAELDRWLADPAGFLPGTTMTFTGYQSAEDRAALIAYLTTVTAP